jgi:DNA repair exonuclease SbcCD nuclease subunit
MKIAITADVHLRTREEHPERYNALENIIEQIKAENIETLIIAGDLFDKDSRSYTDFEKLCKKHGGVQLHIIPGNHDPVISEKGIVGENIHIYTAPITSEIDSTTFLFLPYEEKANMGEKIAEVENEIPYEEKANMGEKIAEVENEIKEEKWVLVAHGDYYGGARQLNPLEPGTYMPLSRKDLERFNPQIVFLGHIHKPSTQGNVNYVGSPISLDINETGKRKFLIYDSVQKVVEKRDVVTDALYFNESFVIVPIKDEVSHLQQEIEMRIKFWEIDPSDYPKVRVRVEVKGYATDRGAILKTLEEEFREFCYYKDEGPGIDNLYLSSDLQLNSIANRTMQLIDDLHWNLGGNEPTKEQVIVAALSAIYGE